MVDTNVVLTGQTFLYTFYVVVVLFIMGWFSYAVTHDQKTTAVPAAFFYSFAAFLVILGVSLHIVTYHTIPWKEMDLNRAKIKADKIFKITVANHKFSLPSEKLLAKTNEKVLFEVTSADLTYGFGLFREDNSMVFQMQVMPGHMNDILWQFSKPGVFSIRSTEYSGPSGIGMIEKNVVVVTD